MSMKERVAVAMSGGVDSSVAAALLKEQGFDVIGLTMYFDFTLQCLKAAKKVADRLKIRHYALDMQEALEEYVIKDFCRQYFFGRTPNPCVRCNKFIKFNFLLKKAFSLGAKYLATGHYARIAKNQGYLLKKGRDKFKDQSYFLYCLRQEQLRHIMFPLGNLTKSQVRKLAESFDLGVAEKKASQEICFLPNQDYREFLKKRISKDIREGNIVDKDGNLLGRHKGIAFYTIGQREGLGIAKGYPLYITEINKRKNQIIVGTKADALKKEFLVKDASFVCEAINPVRGRLPKAAVGHLRCPASNGVKKKVVLKVKIRYNHKEALAEILPIKNKIKVKFKHAQFAVTPGQSAVFYDKDAVVGGGIIERVLN